MTSVTDPNPTTNIEQQGPWWSKILTNRGAVIAAVALYLVYFVTQNLMGTVSQAQVIAIESQKVIINHAMAADASHAVQAEETKKLLWEATLQTRLLREVCWSNAKNDEQRRTCYDADVRIPK